LNNPLFLFKCLFLRATQKLIKDSQLIDYVKMILRDYPPSKLEEIPFLDFYYNINLSTGEIKSKNRKGQTITPFKNAFFRGLEFRIYDTGTITISGSLHKFWNKGLHNYNDFDINGIRDVAKDFKTLFDIDFCQCILKGLEIGINIEPPMQTNDILQYCFLHKTLPFEFKHHSDEGRYIQAQHSQYIVKIYNKKLHYNKRGILNDLNEIMRFEIKYTKMQKLNERGIYSLNDLVVYGLHNFKMDIIKEWENVLFYDRTIQHSTIKLKDYNNVIYWIELLSRESKSSFNKHRKILSEFTRLYSQNIQKQITEIMKYKIELLTEKGTQIDPLNIKSITTPLRLNTLTSKDKVCEVTGVNISMQKDESILLSHSGLKYYHQYDKRIFVQIKRRYLSSLWNDSEFEIQIKAIAHNIRNQKSNQKIKEQRRYSENQFNLLVSFGDLRKAI
jgi:hypothetical protein